jgi:hypothetical protein
VDIPQDSPALNPQELAALFKKKFVRSLKYLKRHGKLDVSHLPEDESFDDWLAPIAAKNWIADAQITPDCLATKEQCSVYLSEYVQGTAISDTRMVEDAEEQCRAKPLHSFSLEGESSAARRGSEAQQCIIAASSQRS